MQHTSATMSASDVIVEVSKVDCITLMRHLVKTFVEGWKNINDNDITVSEVSGGITNNLFRAKIADAKLASVDCVLIRVYGNKTELIIDREKELESIRNLYKTGFGPKLYGTFHNGYIYEYYEGRPVDGKELYSCRWNKKIASTLAKWHSQPSVQTQPCVWTTIENWLKLVPDSYQHPKKDKDFAKLGGMETVRKELQVMKDMAAKLNTPIVLSHNDLLGGNIIVNESNDIVKFIDFEYADSNYQAYDIANHFNEWAGFEADYSRYPNKQQQEEFLTSYLKEYLKQEPTEKQLHDLYVQVNKFALLSHFYWGVWSLVQGSISNIDFDFVDYATLRFAEYFRRKDEFLALQ